MFDTHPSGPDRLAAWDVTTAEVERSPDLMPNLIGEDDAAGSVDLVAETGTANAGAAGATDTPSTDNTSSATSKTATP
jgi:hypothetical protein